MQDLPIFQRVRRLNKWTEEEGHHRFKLRRQGINLEDNIERIQGQITQENIDKIDVKYLKTLLKISKEELDFNNIRIENSYYRTNYYLQQVDKIPLG